MRSRLMAPPFIDDDDEDDEEDQKYMTRCYPITVSSAHAESKKY